MNRKILLGIIIVLGVGFYLYFFRSQKSVQQTDIASTHDQPNIRPIGDSKDNESASVRANEQAHQQKEIRRPNQAPPRSGKYSLKINQPAISVHEEIRKREEFLNRNKTGVVLQSQDQIFVVMSLRASKEKDGSDHDLGHDMFPIDLAQAQKVIVEEETYPVVYHESNGRIGFLTGVILAQTEAKNQAEQIASNYPLDLQIYDSAIGLASFKVKNGEGLYDIYNRIKQNERVKSITVEVLDSYKGF